MLKKIFVQNRHKSSKLCEEKRNRKTEKASIYAAFKVSQTPKRIYR